MTDLVQRAESMLTPSAMTSAERVQQIVNATKDALNPIVEQAQELLAAAPNIKIADTPSYEIATVTIRGLKKAVADIEAEAKPLTTVAFAIHRGMTGAVSEAIKPFKDATDKLDKQRLDYDAKLKREREAEQRRLDDEARAEAARARAAEVAAAKKIADELAAKAKAAKEAGDAEAAKGLAALAKEAKAETRELKAEPLQYVAPVVADTRPVVEGTSRRVTHKARVYDMGAFLRWCADAPDRWSLVEVTPDLNRRAAKWGKPDKGGVVPGVEIYAETSYADKKGTW